MNKRTANYDMQMAVALLAFGIACLAMGMQLGKRLYHCPDPVVQVQLGIPDTP